MDRTARRRDTFRQGALLAAVLTSGLLAIGCSSGEGADQATTTEPPPMPLACGLLEPEEIEAATGSAHDIDIDASTDQQCMYTRGEGPESLSVATQNVRDHAEFRSLVTAGADAEVVDLGATLGEDDAGTVDGADPIEDANTGPAPESEGLMWSEGAGIEVGLARKGGSTVKLTHVRGPDDAPPKLRDLLTLAVERLPESDLALDEAPGTGICERLPIDRVKAALDAPGLEGQPMGGAPACGLSDPGGLNLIIELPEGSAGSDQLESSARVTNMDGKEYVWKVEQVADLGDGATWVLDPISERTGQLTVLYGDRIARISSTDDEANAPLRERAVQVARLIEPAVRR